MDTVAKKTTGRAKVKPATGDLLARLLRRDMCTSLNTVTGGTLEVIADDLDALHISMGGSSDPIIAAWRDYVAGMLLRARIAVELAGRRTPRRAKGAA